MLVIITALDLEAAWLIDVLNLKRNHKIFTHKVFESKNCRLICSGTGKIKAAAAVAKMLALPEDSRLLQKPHLLNIGFAASPNKKIGDLYLINKIRDRSLNSNFYPELYLKNNLPEASLLTVDLPVNGPILNCDYDLLDMEASAVFAAGQIFLPLTQLHFLKVVSDNCSNSFLEKQASRALMSNRQDAIQEYLNNLEAHQNQQNALLTMQEFQKFKMLCSQALLSQTQFAQVEQAFEAFLLQAGDKQQFFSTLNRKISNKHQRTQYLNEILNFSRGCHV